jgi:hypothetical protein
VKAPLPVTLNKKKLAMFTTVNFTVTDLHTCDKFTSVKIRAAKKQKQKTTNQKHHENLPGRQAHVPLKHEPCPLHSAVMTLLTTTLPGHVDAHDGPK